MGVWLILFHYMLPKAVRAYFCGEIAAIPYETAKAIKAHAANARMGVAIIIPIPVIANNPPIIDKNIPYIKAPHPYGCAAGLSKSYPQFGQWYIPVGVSATWTCPIFSFAFCLAANSGFCLKYSS